MHPFNARHVGKDGFRLRGTEMSRVDGFSDVVFGFALTLLVVSLEVPKTYAELHESLLGFFPFAICFWFLMMVWRAHFRFFRRFGLHDETTITLNAVLLFVILFYVYPLKFLFSVATHVGHDAPGSVHRAGEMPELMVLYGVGLAAIYFLLGALYWNGWRQRRMLELNPLEVTLTKLYAWDAVGIGAVGLLSCAVAEILPESLAGWGAGLTYFLIAAVRFGFRRSVKRARMSHKSEQESPKTA